MKRLKKSNIIGAKKGTELFYDSTMDFFAYLADYNNPGSFARTTQYEKSFCSFSYGEALEALQRGWSEGVKSLDLQAASIVENLAQDKDRASLGLSYDVTGDYIDVGAYLDGVPECWGQIEMQAKPHKTIKIVAAIAHNCNIGQDQIINRGAAIAALIDELKAAGYYVGLRCIGAWDDVPGLGNLATEILIDTDNHYSRDAITYMLAHPGLNRRLLFAQREIEAKRDECGNYGRSVDGKKAPGAIHFGVIANNKEYRTIDDATSRVKNILQKIKEGGK